MNSRPLLVCLLALAVASDAAGAADLTPSLDAGKALLLRGDALADRDQGTEAVLLYKQAFEHLLPSMRKLPFKNEVERDVTAREDLRAFLVKELDEDQTPAEFHGDEVGMKALGFLPREADYKEIMVQVYAEEIAAFYDPKTKTMHLIREPEAKAKKPPSFLERLLGKTPGFDKEGNKTVIAHELTHALADQHYDIDAMQTAAKGDDDRLLALTALIEGEATLTMMGAQMNDWSGEEAAALPADGLDWTFRILGPFLNLAGGRSMRQAPPIVAETMLFPYLRGLVFCASLTNKGGWPRIDEAYRLPPLSTEQVLHPAKYRDDPDPPTAIDLGKLDPGRGWTEATRNVVGELQLSILLKKYDGRTASEGWDGDSFAAFEGPDDRLALVWLSTWDTEDDAREFARSYLRFQTTKLGPDADEPDAFPDSVRRGQDDAAFAVERRGLDVAVVEGFPAKTTEALLRSAFNARKFEKTHEPVKTSTRKASRRKEK